MYASHDSAADSSLTLARALGTNKFNVNPLLYEVAGDFARDPVAYRSIDIGYIVQTCFAPSRLDEIALLDVANYVDYEWNRWCATTLENFEPTVSNLEDKERIRYLLKHLENHPKVPYTYDHKAFHGIMSVAEFLERYEKWRPRVGDEAANRRTHIVIIRQRPAVVLPDIPTVFPVPAQQFPAGRQPWEDQLVPIDELSNQMANELNTLRVEDDQEEVVANELEEEADAGPLKSGDSVTSLDHHFAIAFRYGIFSSQVLDRRNLTP